MTHILAAQVEQRCIAENHEVVARAMTGPNLENGKELEQLWEKLKEELLHTDCGEAATFRIFAHEILRVDIGRDGLRLQNSYWRNLFLSKCFDYGLTKAIKMITRNKSRQANKPKSLITMHQDTAEFAYAEVQYLDAGDDESAAF